MKNIETSIAEADEINQDDVEYSSFLSQTCLDKQTWQLDERVIFSHRKYLSDYFKVDLSEEITVLLTAIFENEMPEPEDDVQEMFTAVVNRQKDHITKLKITSIQSNFYYDNIRKLLSQRGSYQEKRIGKTYFGFNAIEPYNVFITDEIFIDSGGHEVTPLGYFPSRFVYPYLADQDRIWMSIIPHEVNTMKIPLSHAHDRVLIYGLGLGYFPLMCAHKSEVSEVTVFESDESVIQIFNTYILPAFLKAEIKPIKIVRTDAVSASKNLDAESFDYVFADIWHNESDGLPVYLQLKAMEQPNIQYDYWIEETLLVYFKRILVTILALGLNEQEYQKNLKLLDKRDQELCTRYKPFLHLYLADKEFQISDLLAFSKFQKIVSKKR